MEENIKSTRPVPTPQNLADFVKNAAASIPVNVDALRKTSFTMRYIPEGQWNDQYKNVLDDLLIAAAALQPPLDDDTRKALANILINIKFLGNDAQKQLIEALTSQSALLTQISSTLNQENKHLPPRKIIEFITKALEKRPVDIVSLSINAYNLSQIPNGRWNNHYTKALDTLLQATTSITFPLKTDEQQRSVLGILTKIPNITTKQDKPLEQLTQEKTLFDQLNLAFETDPFRLLAVIQRTAVEDTVNTKQLKNIAYKLKKIEKGNWQNEHIDVMNALLTEANRLKQPFNEEVTENLVKILSSMHTVCALHGISLGQFTSFDTLQATIDTSSTRDQYLMTQPLTTNDGINLAAVTSVTRGLSKVSAGRWKTENKAKLDEVLQAIYSVKLPLSAIDKQAFRTILRGIGEICDTQQMPLTELTTEAQLAQGFSLVLQLGNGFATEPSKQLSIFQLAHARMQLPMHPQAQQAWFAEVTQRMQNPSTDPALYIDSQGLATNLYALSQLNIMPPDGFLEAWFNAAEQKMNDFSLQHLSLSIYAIGQLAIHPPESYMRVWQKTLRNLLQNTESPDDKNITNPLYSLACLKASGVEGIEDATIAALKPHIRQDGTHKNRSQCFLASQVFPELGNLPNPTHNRSGRESHSATQLADALREALQEKYPGSRVEMEQYLECTNSFVDMVATIPAVSFAHQPERQLWVQFDGPYHFNVDMEGNAYLNGSSTLQNYIAEKNGIPFQRVAYFEVFDENRDVNLEKLQTTVNALIRSLAPQTQGIGRGKKTG